jgi:hypothetical protein
MKIITIISVFIIIYMWHKFNQDDDDDDFPWFMSGY